jgi:hypothetical protein
MTKVIAAFAIIIVLYIGWEVFLYWDKVSHEEETKQKQDAAAMVIGDQLQGVPYQLETSLQNARKQGATGLKNWLKAHGQSIEDPRKAWIELDYCIAVARQDTAEAKRVFAQVKERTPPSSPVWPRIKQLEKTYE